MDLKNVDRNDYCLTLELHKSMFFIDMLKGIYEFTLKGDEVEIFKKLKSGISEPITRKELIYSIQVEMAEKYKYSSIKKQQIHSNLSKEEKHLRAFYIHFDTVDSIHKAIDNIAYLEKFLNKKEVLDEEDDEEEESIDEEESTDEKESRLIGKFNGMGWRGLHHPRGKFEDCGCTSCMNDPSSYHKSSHTRKLVDELKGEFDSLPYGRVKWEKLLKFQ